MSVILRRVAGVTLLVVIAAGAFVVAARSGWLTPDEATLRARYALPESRFIDIDGQSIHYTDEGQGEAVVLVHGSFGSLRMWQDWVQALAPRYRVIRFDRPPMGLSGSSPVGDYGTDREMQIIDALTRQLGVERFALVGTSSAGVSTAGYAAAHPERVSALVLSNVAVGAFDMHVERLSGWFRMMLRVDGWLGGWHLREFWRQVMASNFHDPRRLRPELVREWTDLNNRAQRMPPGPGSENPDAAFARTPVDLPRIVAPTLLLWSANDEELPVETVGRKGLALLGSARKSLEIVADCGHMMPLECGPQSAARALAFLGSVRADPAGTQRETTSIGR